VKTLLDIYFSRSFRLPYLFRINYTSRCVWVHNIPKERKEKSRKFRLPGVEGVYTIKSK